MAAFRPLEMGTRVNRSRADFLLIGTFLALSAIGALMIFTVTSPQLAARGLDTSTTLSRQILFIMAGVTLFTVLSMFDIRGLRHLAPWVYGLSLLLLVVVLSPVGDVRNDVQRWISLGPFDLQPSEFAKPAIVLALAALLSKVQEGAMRWRTAAQALVLVAVPAVLIFRQPDLGTMMVFAFVVMVMLFVAGLTVRQMTVLGLLAIVAVFLVFQFGILKSWQLDRLTAFFNPEEHVLDLNYNLNQSRIAISSGGLFGQGLFQGTQTNLEFVPEQETDFIFTAVGEQLGFMGGIVVIGLFSVLVWRLLVIAAVANDHFGRLLAIGVASIFAFQVFINIGMTMGLAPVTGLPLPLMTFGGSSFLSLSIALGLAHVVWLRRSPVPGDRRLL